MANKDRPFGFEPWGTIISAPNRYYVDASAGTILKGDPVTREADGGVIAATATTRLIGVAAGYHLTGTAGYIEVWDNPYQKFSCQEDGVGTTSAQTHCGNLFDFIDTETANGKQSAKELDISSASAASGQFRIDALAQGHPMDPDNAWGAHAKVVVTINEHYHRNLETGI